MNKKKVYTIIGFISGICAIAFAAQLTNTVITGTLDVSGAVTAESSLSADSVDVGGGYGDTGASISTAGAIQTNSTISADSNITGLDVIATDDLAALDDAAITDELTVGGGYGSTGATISGAGVGQFNGAITTDAAMNSLSATIGGGYGDGDGGISMSNIGAFSANGTILGAGAITAGGLITGNTLSITTSAAFGTDVTIGGDLDVTGDITGNNIDDTNWDTAYTDRLKWDGGATGLVAATGRTSLELGTIATQAANNVAITGGAVDGAIIGGTTAAAGTFTGIIGTSGIIREDAATQGTDPALTFNAKNSGDSWKSYAEVAGVIFDNTEGEEDGYLELSYMAAGTLTVGTKLTLLMGGTSLDTYGAVFASDGFLDETTDIKYVAMLPNADGNPCILFRDYDDVEGEGEGYTDLTAVIGFSSEGGGAFVFVIDGTPVAMISADGSYLGAGAITAGGLITGNTLSITTSAAFGTDVTIGGDLDVTGDITGTDMVGP